MFSKCFPVKALGREPSSLGNHGEAERYPGIQPAQKIKETQIIERMEIQPTRTGKQKKTKRNSDPIVAFIRYISTSDAVHPKINNLTYISRQGYQIYTETNFHFLYVIVFFRHVNVFPWTVYESILKSN